LINGSINVKLTNMTKQTKHLTITGLVAILFLLFSVSSATAQSKYGADSIGCIKNLSLYGEYYKQNNFKDAIKSWRRVFADCPQSSKNIYIHGARMYKDLIDAEKNETRKASLIDSLMLIYDNRIKYFGEEGRVLGSKGIDMLRYKQSDFEPAYTVLKKSMDLEKNSSSASVVSTYYQSVIFMFKADKFTKEQALGEYTKSMEVIDANLAKKPDDKYFISAKEIVNRLLIDEVKPDCALMVGLLQPQYDKAPTDTDLLKKIISTLESKCDDSDLYLKAVISLAEIEKSTVAFTNIAKMYYKKGDKDKASDFYSKATELETDNVAKSKLLYEHSVVMSSNLNRSVALCKQAIALNSANGPAYLMLARHYASGAKSCGEGAEQAAFITKSVYWAAVDLCQKARSVDPSVSDDANGLIASYSAYFPNNEEIFFQGLKDGDSYTINCWFSATTSVRARK
jgi:tetratricopeptide (TPR) repeat protein